MQYVKTVSTCVHKIILQYSIYQNVRTAFLLCSQKFDLYHFTDQITKDVHPKQGWYAGWDIGRRLLFIIVFFGGVYFDTSLRLVRTLFAYMYCRCMCEFILCALSTCLSLVSVRFSSVQVTFNGRNFPCSLSIHCLFITSSMTNLLLATLPCLCTVVLYLSPYIQCM